MKPSFALSGALLGACAISASHEAAAQDSAALFGLSSASVTYGPYARVDVGRNISHFDDAFWRPPGYPADPEIDFSLDEDSGNFGSVALGFDWQNGWRGDISLLSLGSTDASGGCSSASDGTSCNIHADISEAPLETRAIMANVFYAPLEARGSNSVFQPFVTAGLGVAHNKVGDWTRENPASPSGRVTREFEGDTTSNFAWSVGLGASLQVTRPGRWPIIVETTYRYYDFGEAQGSSTPLPNQGLGEPVEPLSFEHTSHVVTLGVRIPLQRY